MQSRMAGVICLVMLIFSAGARSQQKATASPSGYVPVHKYDPSRNAEQDIRAAINEAQRTHKRILLEVGGEWCGWCHLMDRYFEQNAKLSAFRDQHYITVKINFSQENQNQKALSRYPEISGYPHLFVLEQNGKLLHSQDTGLLESGNSYELEKFFAFLKKWATTT
jgi:thiol:disulfide interchange protein